MTEQTDQAQHVDEEPAFGLQLPPNARVKTLTFDDAQRQIHVLLDGSETEQVVPVDRIRSLYGARIRHESLTQYKTMSAAGTASVAFVTMAATGIEEKKTTAPPRAATGDIAAVLRRLPLAGLLSVACGLALWEVISRFIVAGSSPRAMSYFFSSDSGTPA